MTELDRIAGLYIIPLAALFLTAVIVIIGIICFLYLRANQNELKTITAALETNRDKQEAFANDLRKRFRKLENFMRDLGHDHESFERFLGECKKSLERIERNASEIKECQATWLTKNDNAANGNKVKVVSGKDNQNEYQTALLNTIIEQFVDRMQDRNTAPPPITRNKK